MGLFSNDPYESTEEIASYEIKEKEYSKLLFDFERECTFKHGNKLTNLIKARMLDDYREGSTIAPDTAKYICFEIPTYIKLQELAENKVFATLNEIGQLGEAKENSYTHIGIIDKIEENRYELFNPTAEVLSYVEQKMDTQIGKQDKLFAKRLQFVESISKHAIEKINESQKNKEERKKLPTLEEQLRYKIGNNIYTDYKGVDLNSGEILKLNRLECSYSEENINLYSTYIQTLEEEKEIERATLEGVPNGFPILFTLEQKIEEMLKEGNSIKILEFLSNIPKEKLNINKLQYIGGIDTEGRIYRNSENCSNEIKQKIENKIIEYKKQRGAQLEK